MSAEEEALKPLQESFESAQALNNVNPSKSISIYKSILSKNELNFEEINILKEQCIYELIEIYSKESNINELQQLFIAIQSYFLTISSAKTGKIMRFLINAVSKIITDEKNNNKFSDEILINLCKECINWCIKENKIFLKQQIECKLALFYLNFKRYKLALTLMTRLIRDIKKMDDKHLLVEVHLIESCIHHRLRNVPKAKAALTASKTAASSIYIGPLLQAKLDIQSGSLACDEKDYKTAYSYFYESFEGFDSLKNEKLNAKKSLNYMLLTKIMNNQPKDVQSIISSKLALKYQSNDINAMKEIAIAYQERSLHSFENIINSKKYYDIFNNDLIIKNKLKELSNNLLENNLIKLLEPFEKVQIEHIAKLINLPINNIQNKLSQMILDKKFNGILDQGSGAIIVFDDEVKNNSYNYALKTIQVLNDAIDQLFEKSRSLEF